MSGRKRTRQLRNPFKVPDLNPMRDAIKAFVKEHQGDKGYIDTQDTDHDTIYTFVYDYDAGEAKEMRVHGVRVNPDNGDDLEIVFEPDNSAGSAHIVYRDCDFKAKDADWRSVQYDESVYYVPTIFNLAEFIAEYAG